MEKKNNIDINNNFIQHGKEHGLPLEVSEEEEFEKKVMLILEKLQLVKFLEKIVFGNNLVIYFSTLCLTFYTNVSLQNWRIVTVGK